MNIRESGVLFINPKRRNAWTTITYITIVWRRPHEIL